MDFFGDSFANLIIRPTSEYYKFKTMNNVLLYQEKRFNTSDEIMQLTMFVKESRK